MKNWGGHFTPELGGQFELESGGHFKLELGGQYHRNMHISRKTYKNNGKQTTKLFRKNILWNIYVSRDNDASCRIYIFEI